MIDPEDIAPQIKALIQIKRTIPTGHILQGVIDRMIRGLRNWQKVGPLSFDLAVIAQRRAHIEHGFMRGLAKLTEYQWSAT